MENFKQETLRKLRMHGKSKKDVLWCGSKNFGYFSLEDLFAVSPVKYDNGYGSQEIASDLVIVGADFWMEREEYDGSEWWEFKTMPEKPLHYHKPQTITNLGWQTISEMHEIR